MPEDVDISGDEIVAVLKAREGFDALLMEYAKRKPAKRRRTRTAQRRAKQHGT